MFFLALVVCFLDVASGGVSFSRAVSDANEILPYNGQPVTSPYTRCDTNIHFRTVPSIVLSCLTTIFACTWVSIHPDIPQQQGTWWTRVYHRLQHFVRGLLIPEGAIFWALREWFISRAIAKKYQDRGWTQVHGFFVTMGGFVLVDDDMVERTLHPYDFEQPTELDFEFLMLSEEEIQDRSKGDLLSKGLAVLQTAWFETQVIARIAQSLPVTELEILTIGFAVANFFLYTLWWYKPLDIRVPIPLKRARRDELKLQDCEDCECNELRDGTVDRAMGWVHAVVQMNVDRIYELTNGEGPVFSFLVQPVRPYAEIGGIRFDGKADSSHRIQPPRGIGGLDATSTMILLLVDLIFAAVFGSIHLVAWSFPFPSLTEKVLWRAAAAAITFLPIIFGFFLVVGGALWAIGGVDLSKGHRLWDIFIALMGVFLIPNWYCCSRILLLVLPFISLRSLPLGICQTVQWTALIPHIS